tara:strand:- start:733 stop:1155 length:423 start_codon:yes stop_codon:yes gene_type:complete
MLNDGLKLTGKLSIAINDEVVKEVPNLVVTAGKNYVADRIKNNSTVMSHMAIGTGSTAAAAGDTALGSQTARTALTSTTVTNNEIVYVDTFPAGTGTGAITEAGIFNASSGGTMLCRTVFSVVNKGANDAMTITWTVTVS